MSLVIREMQIKTIVECHFKHMRMAINFIYIFHIYIYPKEMKIPSTDISAPMLIIVFFTIAKR
jgi:hypothetical protein